MKFNYLAAIGFGMELVVIPNGATAVMDGGKMVAYCRWPNRFPKLEDVSWDWVHKNFR